MVNHTKTAFLSISIISIMLISSVFAYASLASFAVNRLAMSGAVAGQNGAMSVPALIKGSTSGGASAGSWVALAIPSTAGAKIAGAVLGVTAGLALDYVMAKGAAWFAENNLNANLQRVENVPVPIGHTLSEYHGLNSAGMGHGMYTSSTAAYQAADGYHESNRTCTGNPTSSIYPDEAGVYFFTIQNGCEGYRQHYFYYMNPQTPHNVETQATQWFPSMVENKLKLDISGGNTNAVEVVKAGLEVAAAALDNPSHPVALKPETMAVIRSTLNGAVTVDQQASLEAEAVPMTDANAETIAKGEAVPQSSADIAAAVQAALAGQNLSAKQIADAIAAAQGATAAGLTEAQTKAAVKAALDDETGVTVPVDSAIVMPTKLSLTSVLNSFMTSINNLPFVATLSGLTINCSGSSSLCLNMSEKYGGVRCYNAAAAQDSFNSIGTVMLSITSLLSFMYIFRG